MAISRRPGLSKPWLVSRHSGPDRPYVRFLGWDGKLIQLRTWRTLARSAVRDPTRPLDEVVLPVMSARSGGKVGTPTVGAPMPYFRATISATAIAMALSVSAAWPAHAWNIPRSAYGIIDQYVQKLRTQGNAVFVSQCRADDHTKAILVFQAGSKSGDFFVVRDAIRPNVAFATASGQVTLDNGTTRVHTTESDQVFDRVALNLLSYRFSLLSADEASKIFADEAIASCWERPN